MSNAERIRLSNVTKVHGLGTERERRVLLDVSLSISDGEILAILGPTGCGKTTLLRLAAGLDTPTSGSVSYLRNRTKCVLIPQEVDLALLPWLTLRKSLVLAAKHRRQDADPETTVDMLWNQFGQPVPLDRYPYQLSGGQRQVVAIALAVASGANVLLMDEAITGLDVGSRYQLLRLVSNLAHRDKLAVVLVTHNVQDAVVVADRLIVLGGNPSRIVSEEQNSPSIETDPSVLLRSESVQRVQRITSLLTVPLCADV